MRLSILEHGHRARVRLFFAMASGLSRAEMADVPKTLLYRPEFCGAALVGLAAAAMRGPSYWTAGEREHIAAVTARLLECPYCVTAHTDLTRIASAGEIDPAAPDSVRPSLRAVLAFLERVTLRPDEVGPADLAAARAAEVPDAAVVEALHVCLIWNVVNRLANAFDFQLGPGWQKGTRSLHRFGYRFPRILLGSPAGGGEPPGSGELAGGGERAGGDGAAPENVALLRRSVFGPDGVTSPRLRRAAADGDPMDGAWSGYGALVRDSSHRVSDADVERLRRAGHSEDEIFEITVAAAVGAGLRGLDAGLRAVDHPIDHTEEET